MQDILGEGVGSKILISFNFDHFKQVQQNAMFSWVRIEFYFFSRAISPAVTVFFTVNLPLLHLYNIEVSTGSYYKKMSAQLGVTTYLL